MPCVVLCSIRVSCLCVAVLSVGQWLPLRICRRFVCWVSDFRFCGVVVSCVGCLPLVGVQCLPLRVYLPLVGVCCSFLRWVSAFGRCIMASFVCMSVFLRLGVCFC